MTLILKQRITKIFVTHLTLPFQTLVFTYHSAQCGSKGAVEFATSPVVHLSLLRLRFVVVSACAAVVCMHTQSLLFNA